MSTSDSLQSWYGGTQRFEVVPAPTLASAPAYVPAAQSAETSPYAPAMQSAAGAFTPGAHAKGGEVALAADTPSFARIAVRYAIAAAGCVAFNFIYAQFAHGVASAFMTYMFAIPLVLGTLPALVLGLVKARPLPVAARQAWGLAVAALTVASCLHGIFDIAGTASPWLPVYLVAAAAFACAAAIMALRALRE